MNKLTKFFKNHYPILGLLAIVLALFATNYVPHTYLTGWDNLHPEFSFGMNIKRSIFAVWQEYQGLGLLGGMGHSTDLLRQIFLAVLSVIIPNELLRYFWVFLTLFIGNTGIYFLVNYLFKETGHENKLVAFAAAVFYLLNISTVQIYFVAFEAFIAHFAFLPWILLVSLKFIKKPNRRTGLIAFITFLITSPQAYIPTLFVSTMMAIGIVSLPFFYKNFKNTFVAFIKLLLIIFVSNAYWLLPFIFFTITNSSVNLDSKINQMATGPIFLQNKEYGDLANVALLKGFLFGNVEPNSQGVFVYLLGAWRNFLSNPFILFLTYLFFGIILVGIVKAVKLKKPLSISFVLLFLLGFTMLATNTPPFEQINNVLRDNIPLFNQSFRFPYTKFLTLAAVAYSVLFGFGILFLTEFIKKNKLKILPPIILISLIFVTAIPAFRGNFLYEKETLKIPQEYFQTFDYFKSVDQNTRIANFPQYTFWGWNFYNWGYSGSGFLWYGIKQPIIDRAFDVWSKEDENYYWEMNQALYSKNPDEFLNVLNKYDVNWLLVDKNVVSPVSPKSLFFPEINDIIKDLPEVKLAKKIGNIEIYKVDLKDSPKAYISSLKNLSSSNAYIWSGYDQSYQDFGDYFTSNDLNKSANYFPFRSLFTDKQNAPLEYNISEKGNYIEFTSPLPAYKDSVNLSIPSLVTANRTIPVNIVAQEIDDQIKISLVIHAPEVLIKNGKETKKVWGQNIEEELFLASPDELPLNLNVNGISDFEVNKINSEPKVIGTTILSLDQNNKIVLSKGDDALLASEFDGEEIREFFTQNETFVQIPSLKKNSQLLVRVPKFDDKYSSITIDPAEMVKKDKKKVQNCDNFRKEYFSYRITQEQQNELLQLTSKNANTCIAFYVPTLDHDQGYIVSIGSKNISDEGLHFWVLNEDQKIPVVDTYLKKNQELETTYTIIPPMEKFGKAYSIHFDNISIGDANSRNALGLVEVNPIPYYFLSNIKINNPEIKNLTFEKTNLSVKHPNESLYLVNTSSDKPYAFALSQSYSKYWKAYEVNNFKIFNRSFPFIFGKEIKNHVIVNNWENGWIVEAPTKPNVIVVYLPQYLQYIGFALTTGALIGLIYACRRKLT